MLHARKDYNRRIQDSGNLIPDNEPVFLLRGQDKLTLTAMDCYLRHLQAEPDHDKAVEAGILWLMSQIVKWQQEHPPKSADIPPEELM